MKKYDVPIVVHQLWYYEKNLKRRKHMKTWIIKYYLTEVAFKSGVAAFTETIRGDRNYAVSWAQNKIKHSNFKFYDLTEK